MESEQTKEDTAPVGDGAGSQPQAASILDDIRKEREGMANDLKQLKDERAKFEQIRARELISGTAYGAMKQETAEEKMDKQVKAVVERYLPSARK